MTKPQIATDDQLAVLVAAATKHGCTPLLSGSGDVGTQALAFLTFADPTDALEFLLQTAVLMDYTIGDRVLLGVHRPLSSEGPGAKLVWHPSLTPELVKAWS